MRNDTVLLDEPAEHHTNEFHGQTPDTTTTPAAAVPQWLPDTIASSKELQKQQERQQEKQRGLFRLQEWLMEMYRRNLATLDTEGVVQVAPQVSSRFALGLKDKRAFLVMPDLEVGWAASIGWRHAAMREGVPTLYLVAEQIEIDGQEAPEFGVSFGIPDLAKAQAMTTQARLQLRRFKQGPSGWSVDPKPFSDMPVVVLGEGTSVFDAHAKSLKYKKQGSI